MTDPIKEQAEKELLDKGLNNLVISKGDKKPYVYCSDAMAMFVEKHIREKASLESQLAEAKAHNLELTQALKHTSDTANRDRDPFRSCSMICEYVYKQLSSPASRKYLAMIQKAEWADRIYQRCGDDPYSNYVLTTTDYAELEALESEEA